MSTRCASRLAPMVLGTLLVLFSPVVLVSHAQNQLWLKQIGTNKIEVAQALASDGEGGVMIAGYTWGSLGGPWAGWGGDAFLARYDNEGNQLWMRQFGSRQWEAELSLSPDGAGGVMIAGTTWGSLARTNNSRWAERFLARYDSEGSQLWIRQFGTSANDHAYALATDGAQGAIIAGSAGGGDAYVARFNSQGKRIWLREFGSGKGDRAYALAPDGTGGAFVSGYTSGDLGGRNAGEQDVFLARLNHAGKQLWIKQIGSRGSDRAFALAPDSEGGVIVAGYTTGSLGGTYAGGGDVFLARFDGNGNQLWIRQFGTNRTDKALALASDGAGGVLVAGVTEGSLAGFNAGSSDGFLARFDADGNQLWLRQVGTYESDVVNALALDSNVGVMVAGATAGSFGGPSAGEVDAFLARFAIDSCYADCDQSTGGGNGALDIFDFLCWQNDFVIGKSYACDCDVSTGSLVCDMFDFICFQDAFVAGCR